jgi:hypothetical protein
LREDAVADGVHEVGLAESDAAVQEQGVVGAARVLGHLEGAGARKLIALALDETLEGEIRIEPRASEKLAARRGAGPWHRGCGPPCARGFDAGPGLATADVDGYVHGARRPGSVSQ